MSYVILVLLLLAVVWIVSAPLRRARAGGPAASETADVSRRIELEAARDAKYREIRDAELDHQTGKISDQDHQAIDSTLRAEAVDLLHQLDALEGDQPDDSA